VLADLLDLATGSSTRTRENAVSALLNLVRCGGDVVAGDVRDALAFGAMDGIADVKDKGSVKEQSKAFELMRVIVGDVRSHGDVCNHGNVVLNSGSSFCSLMNEDSGTSF
jgi:hypothetical protein